MIRHFLSTIDGLEELILGGISAHPGAKFGDMRAFHAPVLPAAAALSDPRYLNSMEPGGVAPHRGGDP